MNNGLSIGILSACGAATVRFSKDSSRQEALATLGGGISGKFRIDHRRATTGGAASVGQTNGHPAIGSAANDRSSVRIAVAQAPDGWQTVSRRLPQASENKESFIPRRFQDVWN